MTSGAPDDPEGEDPPVGVACATATWEAVSDEEEGFGAEDGAATGEADCGDESEFGAGAPPSDVASGAATGGAVFEDEEGSGASWSSSS